jgi:hypothetical protein
MLMNRTPSAAKAVFEAVVKSLSRDPMTITRSAVRARRLAAVVPVTPIAPTACGASNGSDPFPACVSPTGMPVARVKAASAPVASLYSTPPPATTIGRDASRMRLAACRIAAASGRLRGIAHTRVSNNASGNSAASACTSCGSASVTAPVSAGDVSTRIASIKANGNCSGRLIRSQYFETGLKQSFTDTSRDEADSSCWSTGSGSRVAKISPGSSKTGSRLIVAAAAPVTMLVAPGPIELVHASVRSRLLTFANAAAVCTIACSFRGR